MPTSTSSTPMEMIAVLTQPNSTLARDDRYVGKKWSYLAKNVLNGVCFEMPSM